jgi:hypothetical protein
MRGRLLTLVAAAVLLSGCSDILPQGPGSRLEFACAVLDPDVAGRVVVHAWVADGIALDVEGAHQALGRELGRLGARDGGVSFALHGLDEPSRGWDDATLRRWVDDLPFDLGDEVHLHVLWTSSLGSGTALLVGPPGVVAIAADAVAGGAQRLNVSADDVARAVLLHAVGHALGAVNQGIPVQDAAVAGREGPAGHDPDPASVLHAGWEDQRTMRWAANATYDAYGQALRGDWA